MESVRGTHKTHFRAEGAREHPQNASSTSKGSGGTQSCCRFSAPSDAYPAQNQAPLKPHEATSAAQQPEAGATFAGKMPKNRASFAVSPTMTWPFTNSGACPAGAGTRRTGFLAAIEGLIHFGVDVAVAEQLVAECI